MTCKFSAIKARNYLNLVQQLPLNETCMRQDTYPCLISVHHTKWSSNREETPITLLCGWDTFMVFAKMTLLTNSGVRWGDWCEMYSACWKRITETSQRNTNCLPKSSEASDPSTGRWTHQR